MKGYKKSFLGFFNDDKKDSSDDESPEKHYTQ